MVNLSKELHSTLPRWSRACRQAAALSCLTALEAMRQPICLLLATTCVLLIGLTPMLLMYQFGEDGKLVRDSALATHLVFGLLIAGYAASSCLARETRSGTASAVLCKPVSRELLYLAKFAGIAGVILVFSLCASIATLLSERVAEKFVFTRDFVGYVTDWRTGKTLVAAPFAAFAVAGLLNYLTKRPFQTTAFGLLVLCLLLAFVLAGRFDRTGTAADFDYRVDWRLLPASCLVTMALLMLCAIALAVSARFQTAPTLIAVSLFLVLGLMSDYLFGRTASQTPLATLCYALLPNWQHFWAADALNRGGSIPWTYVAHVASYAASYAAAFLCLGALCFRHSEIT